VPNLSFFPRRVNRSLMPNPWFFINKEKAAWLHSFATIDGESRRPGSTALAVYFTGNHTGKMLFRMGCAEDRL